MDVKMMMISILTCDGPLEHVTVDFAQQSRKTFGLALQHVVDETQFKWSRRVILVKKCFIKNKIPDPRRKN